MLIRVKPFGQWHYWFAWRPVLVDCLDGTEAWAWLRWIEWRVDIGSLCLTPDYRLPVKASDAS